MTRRTTLVLTVGLAIVLLWLLAGGRVADQRHNAEDLDSGLRASSAGNGSSGGGQHTEISNGRIVFIRHSDLYVMNSDGTSQTRLIRATDTRDFEVGFESPAWSPDGEKIAFMRTTRVDFVNSSLSSAVPATGPSGLYVMKPDGTGLKKLSKELPYAQSPLWSPEGKEIAFSGAEEKKYIVNADGTELRELMPNVQDHISSYSWSPNGEKIAFAAVHYRGELDIYEIDAHGTGQTNLTSTKTIIEVEPSWSPDGKQIAFTRADAGDFFVDQDVYVMNVDGTGRTRLANNASSPSFAPRDR
jgi:Tol biopolymer transport system component